MKRRFDALVHVTPDGAWPNRRDDASWGRLVEEMDRGHVTRACLVGLAGLVENDFIEECARRSVGRLVPVAGLDPTRLPNADALEAEFDRMARAGFRAIKLHPRLNGFDPLDPRCLAAIASADRRGWTVFLDTLFRQHGRAVASPADIVDRIASAHPRVRMVLLHGGGPALLAVAEVARLYERLFVDLSFTLMKYAGSSVDADIRWLMRNFDRRVVVGSDMPEITPFDAFARAEALADGLPAEKWDNISYGNLERLFEHTVSPAA